jgi:hypothetical protein
MGNPAVPVPFYAQPQIDLNIASEKNLSAAASSLAEYSTTYSPATTCTRYGQTPEPSNFSVQQLLDTIQPPTATVA